MQITDDLVNKITTELLKRLGAGPLAGLTVPAAESDLRPRALVMGPEGSLSQALAAALGLSLQVEFKPAAFNNLDDLEPYRVFVLTRMSCTGLAQLALGFDEGCAWESRLALAGLMRGAKVFALEEGLAWRAHQATASKNLVRYYTECEKTVQSYGLRLISEAELPGAIKALRWGSSAPAPDDSRPRTALSPVPAEAPAAVKPMAMKKVLTESDVAELCREGAGSLAIPAGTIITPLALDYLNAHKVTVVKG